MDNPAITADEIETLCGRPLAFTRLVAQLLTSCDAGHQEVEVQHFARGARIDVDIAAGATWWLWPWDPDPRASPDPWARIRSEDLRRQLRGGFSCNPYGVLHNREGLLRVALARAPADPSAWAEALASWLRPRIDREDLRVELLLPDELARRASRHDGFHHGLLAVDDQQRHWLRSSRALARRGYGYSASERALITALDQGRVDHPSLLEHWVVVADELQSRGDPLGESLALAVAAQVGLRERALVHQQLARREAARMAEADKHNRLLAFADERGRSFDVADFLDADDLDAAADHEPRHSIQLWVSRFGPFVTRLLASCDYEPWFGLGVPEALLAAPELRYLSPRRLSCIDPRGTDLSGRDLSGFEFTHLIRIAPSLTAVEASLRDCDLRQADLSGFVLDGADLRGADSDLGTKISGASFVEARVSPRLHRRLQSWNGGLFRLQRGEPAGVRGIRVEA